MTQLNVARELETGPTPASRVRAAIEQGQQETAKRLLLDYARDAGSPESRDSALILASRLAMAIRDQDVLGKDTSADRAAIVGGMLELLRRIEEEERAEPAPPPPSTRRPVLLSPAPAGAPRAPEQVPEPTRLERERTEFESGSRKRPTELNAAFVCEGLGKRYGKAGTAFALKDVSVTIRPGEILGLVGANGSGKTTFLRLAAGEHSHTEGKLRYPCLGGSDEPLNWASIRPQIAHVQQMPSAWYGRLRTNLQLVAAKHGYMGQDNANEVDFWLHRLGLERYRNAGWDEISGGYKMRFELARAMLCRPKLLILDEPLAPLDIITQRMFLQDLSDLAASRRAPLAMLVSSQHLYEIELIANQLLFLREGRVAYSGAPNAFRSTEGGNLFELACSLACDQLTARLLTIGECRVEGFGKRFLVRTPDTVSAQVLLDCLSSIGARIEYFHDLTHSTRRLFEEGRRRD